MSTCSLTLHAPRHRPGGSPVTLGLRPGTSALLATNITLGRHPHYISVDFLLSSGRVRLQIARQRNL